MPSYRPSMTIPILTIPNPHFETMVTAYPHLEPVVIIDKHMKDQLPVHVILGVEDYANNHEAAHWGD